MKNLCLSLMLVLACCVFPSPCLSQALALADAPEPTAMAGGSSSSLNGSAAIVPVARRPVEKTRERFTSTDWTMLGAGAALRFLDYKSTVRCMSDPANFREVELPQALVHNRPGLGAFEASTVVANYYAYRLLVDHGHRRLARLGQWVNIGAMAWTVGRNYYELNEFWPRYNVLRLPAQRAAQSR